MRRYLKLAPAVVLLLLAAVGPLLAPHPVDEPVVIPYAGPSAQAPLGGDQLGRDVLSRLLAGGLAPMAVAAVIAVLVTGLAAVLGAVAALRPRVGRVIEWCADMLILLPVVLAMMLVVLSWPGGGTVALVVAAVVVGLPYAVRVVAGAAAPVAASGYVEVAAAGGERLPHLVWREVLPNLRSTLLTLLGLRFVAAVYVVTTAGFLEIGPRPPEANWALMVRENAAGIQLNPWSVLAPSLAIGAVAVAVNLATDTLSRKGNPAGRVLPNRTSGERDANRPQVRGRTELSFPHATNTLNSGEAEQRVVVRDLRVCDSNGRTVLDNGELTVTGGVTALVGPSGSGKTTLLRAIAGALPAGLSLTSGTVRVLGHDLHALPDEQVRALRRERIGFVGQDPAAGLNPRMRVRRLLTELADRDAVPGLLAEVRLPDEVLRRRPGQLSGGQQRRVALARGLARDPALLLLDEPTAGMDPGLRKEITDLLRDLGTRLTVVFACHDPEVVAAIADHVVDLGGGATRTPELPARAPARSGTPVLSVRGLSAWAGRRRVLTDVSLDLAAGETLAVTGESGAGKTTLARVVAGLHRTARAELTLAGERLDVRVGRRKPVQRRQVQLVPQDPRGTLNPSRTVRQTIARPLALHRLRPPHAVPDRVAELLDQVSLARDLADRYPHELSGGQRQRVAIARALAAEPAVLLCDEVTSALDGHTAESVMALLAGLRADGLAIMLISHDLGLVDRHADRVLELGAATTRP